MKKRIIVCLFIIILGILIILSILGIVFRHELKTLSSLKEKSNGTYTMTYNGDYGFDEFLEIGAKCDKDIETFITKRLLKGIPINLNVTDAGCTRFCNKR